MDFAGKPKIIKSKILYVWNATYAGVEPENTFVHSGVVTSVSFNDNGTKIVSGSWDNTVRVWNAGPGPAYTLETLGSFEPNLLQISVVGNLCAVATRSGIFLVELYPMQQYEGMQRTYHRLGRIVLQTHFAVG